jgi:hypothetical protein
MKTFKHSGNAGDIIYSLPCIKSHSNKAIIQLALDVPLEYKAYHPNGGVQLNKTMFDMLRPLLNYQEYVHETKIWDGSPVDYDLDIFRKAGLDLSHGDIITWYNHVYPFIADLSKSWLKASAYLPEYSDKIVLVHSHRYHSPLINYQFMQDYKDRIVFLGVEKEHEDFQAKYFNVERVVVNDFLEMANIIASCKLFVGNQTMGYAIAEALKVNRLLEQSPSAHNVHPHGANAGAAIYQNNFDKLFKDLLYL